MRTARPGKFVISRLHPSFRRDFAKLPREIRQRAKAAYLRFQIDPSHPGLQFKPLHTTLPLWSVRVTDSYRAVGVRESHDKIIWFFIGNHSEYDRLLANL
jgi:mRNA-degrading endonuclease RelE of RelBE toxin-antitoxin system